MARLAHILILLLPLLGCSENQRSACELLDTASFNERLGASLTALPETISTSANKKIRTVQCRYSSSGSPINVSFWVRVQPGVPKINGMPSPPLVRVKRLVKADHELSEYRGLGDGAVWDATDKRVIFFKNTSVLGLKITGLPDEAVERKSLELAALIASRIEARQ